MYYNLLFQRFLLLNMFRATHRPSSGTQKLYLQLSWLTMTAAGNHRRM